MDRVLSREEQLLHGLVGGPVSLRIEAANLSRQRHAHEFGCDFEMLADQCKPLAIVELSLQQRAP